MSEPEPLSYATPTRRPRRPLIGGLPCAFMAVAAAVIVGFGVLYVWDWYDARRWHVADDRDLPFGIGACVVGVTLLVLSTYLSRRATKAGRAGK